jgi:phage terminase Nu1 subunit (DNA packaging protein)
MKWLSGEFSKIIGKSQMQISRYRKDGMPFTQEGKNYYFNYSSIKWLFNTGIEQIDREVNDDSIDVESLPARERKDLADAKNKEFDLAVKEGRFILLEIPKTNGTTNGSFVREIFSSLPDRFIPRLELNEEIKHYLRTELKIEIHAMLVSISNFVKG